MGSVRALLKKHLPPNPRFATPAELREVAAELPAGMGGELSGALDNQPARSMTADNAILRLRLPDADKLSAKPFKQLWHAEVKPR